MAMLVGQVFAMDGVPALEDGVAHLALAVPVAVDVPAVAAVVHVQLEMRDGGTCVAAYRVGDKLFEMSTITEGDISNHLFSGVIQKTTGAMDSSGVLDMGKWRANMGIMAARYTSSSVLRVLIKTLSSGRELEKVTTAPAGYMPGAIAPLSAEGDFLAGQKSIADVYRSLNLGDMTEITVSETWSIPSISAATFGSIGWELGDEYVVKTYLAAFELFRGKSVFAAGTVKPSNCFIAQVHDASGFSAERIAAIEGILAGTGLSFNKGPFNYFPAQADGLRGLFFGRY
jgi:hypothetical protein